MHALFERYGVRVVALSKDTVDQARAQRVRDGLEHLTLLSDADFSVTDRFGLRHRAGIQFHTFTVGSVPLGFPVGFRDMAVPTTLLVDEHGTIRWIDQAEDYRMRGDATRVETALAAAFGP